MFAAGYARLGLGESLQHTVMLTGGRTLLYNVFDSNHQRDLITCMVGDEMQVMRIEVVCNAPVFVSHIMGPALTLDSGAALINSQPTSEEKGLCQRTSCNHVLL